MSVEGLTFPFSMMLLLSFCFVIVVSLIVVETERQHRHGQADEQPDWQPREEDLVWARLLLGATYYDRVDGPQRRSEAASAAQCDGVAWELERERERASKRAQGEHLLAASPGNWKTSKPVHWCRPGCLCKTRSDAVMLAWRALLSVACSRYMAEPVCNKWLSVYLVA